MSTKGKTWQRWDAACRRADVLALAEDKGVNLAELVERAGFPSLPALERFCLRQGIYGAFLDVKHRSHICTFRCRSRRFELAV